MSRRTKGRKELEERIGHSFAESALLDSALTHISALGGKSRSGSYRRLEFPGDHVLGLVARNRILTSRHSLISNHEYAASIFGRQDRRHRGIACFDQLVDACTGRRTGTPRHGRIEASS